MYDSTYIIAKTREEQQMCTQLLSYHSKQSCRKKVLTTPILFQSTKQPKHNANCIHKFRNKAARLSCWLEDCSGVLKILVKT